MTENDLKPSPASGSPSDDADSAPVGRPADGTRAIELEIEVPGTPEQVWQAIATGPGISSWYVPHTVQERAGGAASASFGEAPQMQVDGRVVTWEPPRRLVMDGGTPDSDEPAGGFVFEWLVQARDGGSCVVRLVNSGFGNGAEWDDQYDQMTEGWKLFLGNLKLHLTHFPGQAGTSVLPMSQWSGPREVAWARLTGALGLPVAVTVGQRVRAATDTPGLAGTVSDTGPTWMALVLDEPAPGTAFIAAEGDGEQVGVSVWSYLYGPDSVALAARELPRWQAWLEGHAVVAP